MEDIAIDIEPSSCIFYHSLCELNEHAINPNSYERVLPRKNIKLLTYNIFLRPPLIKNNDNDWKDERLEDFCKLLHDYDIICLQEMFGAFNSRKQSLIRAATKSGFFFYVDTSSPSFLSKYMVDGGLIILSRFPIISFSFSQYRYGVISDSLAQKGLLYAKILIKDCFLHLFSTHLQASYLDSGESHFQVSCETRMAQIFQVNHLMGEVLKLQYNIRDKIMLVGDFNVDAQKYKFKKPSGLTSNNISSIEKEYDDMMTYLNLNSIHTRDVFQYYKNFNPITYGDKDPETGEMESCLTHIEDLGSRQSLDYIFECFYIDEIKLKNSNQDLIGDIDENNKNKPTVIKEKRLNLDPDLLRVEKFVLRENQRCNSDVVIIQMDRKKYSQLSDHYGLCCELVYTKIDDAQDKDFNEKKDKEDSFYMDERLNEEQKSLLDNI